MGTPLCYTAVHDAQRFLLPPSYRLCCSQIAAEATKKWYMTTPMTYASFLLRLWREEQPAPSEPAAAWQSELKHIQSGGLWTFSTLDELLGFLRQQVEEPEVLGRAAASIR